MFPPLLVILVLTLVPDPSAGEPLPPLCLLCGRRAVADALLNVGLFVPLGLALGAAGARFLPTFLAGLLLTVGIETAQLWIPGRVSSSGDILTNAAGIVIGWLLFRAGAALWSTPRRRAALAWGAAALPPVVIAGTGVLLAPAFPDTAYIAEWTPVREGQPFYDGTLHAVRLGEMPAPDAPLGARSGDAAARLRTGEPLVIDGTAGSFMPRAAPLFRIRDTPGREILLVAAYRDAAYFRFWTRGAALLFDQPELRHDDAFLAAPPGEPFRLELRRNGRAFCLRMNADESCGLRYSAADGWRLLLNPISIPTRGRVVLGWLWLVGLAVPAGLLAARRPAARLRNAAIIGAGVGAAVIATGTIVMTVPEGLALGAGYLLGLAAREVWNGWRRGARGGRRRADPLTIR